MASAGGAAPVASPPRQPTTAVSGRGAAPAPRVAAGPQPSCERRASRARASDEDEDSQTIAMRCSTVTANGSSGADAAHTRINVKKRPYQCQFFL